MLIACGSNDDKSDVKQSLISTIDVSANYPIKEIVLQDIAKIKYIPLETKDDVLIDNTNLIGYVSEDSLIVCNRSQGDVMIFDNNGKFINKFNHKGQSGMEYRHIINFEYCKNSKEIFISEFLGKKIQVYDISGKYQRSLNILDNVSLKGYTAYNDTLMLGYQNDIVIDNDKSEVEDSTDIQPFMLFKKQDGSIVSTLNVRIKERLSMVRRTDGVIIMGKFNTVIPKYDRNCILDDISSDTVYSLAADFSLRPILIKQPPILSVKKDDRVFTEILSVSSKYIFLYLTKWNATQKKYENTNIGINRETQEIFQCKITNKNFADKDFFKYLRKAKFINADELIDALEENKLSGKLKTIAEQIKADDNPVAMTVEVKN